MKCSLAVNLDGGLKGNMIYLVEKQEQLPGKVECQLGSAEYKECVGGVRNE